MKNLLLLFLAFNVFATDTYTPQTYHGAGFDDTNVITEEEEKLAESYIHSGISQEEMEKLCNTDEVKDLCTQKELAFYEEQKFMGMPLNKVEKILPIVAKAYAAVGNLIKLKEYEKMPKGKRDAGKYKGTDGNATGDKKEANKKDQQDYCAMVATAGELIASGTQALAEDKIQRNYQEAKDQEKGVSMQMEALYAVSMAQQSRHKTATMQASIWGASVGCYAAMMLVGGTVPNGAAIGKIAAASILTAFYTSKAISHKKRAKAIDEIIEKLPKAGVCDPFKNRSCFCHEKTSRASDPTNYKKFCMPREYSNRTADYPVSCLDSSNSIDHSCNCLKTNSCISTKFTSPMGALKFGTNSAIDPLGVLKSFENGFDEGYLNSQNQQNGAFSKKALATIKPEMDNNINLNDANKEIARLLSEHGIPKLGAAMVASLPPSNKVTASSLKMDSPFNNATSKKAKALGYSSSGSQSKSKSYKQEAYKNPFSKFGKKNETAPQAVTVEDYGNFAEKAMNEAEITKDSSKPLFDIITYRYKFSAWKKFEDQMKKEIEEEKN